MFYSEVIIEYFFDFGLSKRIPQGGTTETIC